MGEGEGCMDSMEFRNGEVGGVLQKQKKDWMVGKEWAMEKFREKGKDIYRVGYEGGRLRL